MSRDEKFKHAQDGQRRRFTREKNEQRIQKITALLIAQGDNDSLAQLGLASSANQMPIGVTIEKRGRPKKRLTT